MSRIVVLCARLRTSLNVFALAALAACGGGGSGGDSVAAAVPSSTDGVKTGHFIDAAVQGLDYYIEGVKAGTTNASGEFTYTPGQAVTFKIGSVTLGTVNANDLSMVTPASLASSTASVNNILVLLQSLDSDGQPDNGIVIPADTGAKLKTATDLSQAGSTLATVKQDLPTQTWVTADAAVQHFATGVSTAAPGSDVVSAVDRLVGFWHYSCDGRGHSMVEEIAKAAPNKIHFVRSVARTYANANCSGSFTEATKGTGSSVEDFLTVLGAARAADGSLTAYGVFKEASTGLQKTSSGTISADGNALTISGESWQSIRRVSGYAFP